MFFWNYRFYCKKYDDCVGYQWYWKSNINNLKDFLLFRPLWHYWRFLLWIKIRCNFHKNVIELLNVVNVFNVHAKISSITYYYFLLLITYKLLLLINNSITYYYYLLLIINNNYLLLGIITSCMHYMMGPMSHPVFLSYCIFLIHLWPPFRSTFAVRETASLGITGEPRVPP